MLGPIKWLWFFYWFLKNIFPLIMFHFKFILLCVVEGGLMENSGNLSYIHDSLPSSVILGVTLSLWLSLSLCIKWKYCTHWSLSFFPSLFHVLTFSLPTSKYFLLHRTGKDLWGHLIFISHLAQEKADWEVMAGADLEEPEWESRQGFGTQVRTPSTVTQISHHGKGSISYVPGIPYVH